MPRPLIAIAADGVLFDYNLGFERAWQQARRWLSSDEMRQAFVAAIQPESAHQEAAPEDQIERQRCVEFWSSLPAAPKAVQACELLDQAGFELVCVAATNVPELVQARVQNLLLRGFPIRQVLIAPLSERGINPMTTTVMGLAPVAVVDHYLPRLQGLASSIHTALIGGTARMGGDPHRPMRPADSAHPDLLHFARWWLAR